MGIITLDLPIIGNPNATEDPKIRANFVTLQTAFNGNIDTANIADNAITLPKMADASVGSIELVDSNVTSAKLADSAVTSRKFAPTVISIAGSDPSGVGPVRDLVNSTINFTTNVVSTLLIIGTCGVTVATAGGALNVRVFPRLDGVTDPPVNDQVFGGLGGPLAGSHTFWMPIVHTFTGITAAAHNVRLRASGTDVATCSTYAFHYYGLIFAQ